MVVGFCLQMIQIYVGWWIIFQLSYLADVWFAYLPSSHTDVSSANPGADPMPDQTLLVRPHWYLGLVQDSGDVTVANYKYRNKNDQMQQYTNMTTHGDVIFVLLYRK